MSSRGSFRLTRPFGTILVFKVGSGVRDPPVFTSVENDERVKVDLYVAVSVMACRVECFTADFMVTRLAPLVGHASVILLPTQLQTLQSYLPKPPPEAVRRGCEVALKTTSLWGFWQRSQPVFQMALMCCFGARG